MAAMIHQVIRGPGINFCDDELPIEGRSHNKALHITVICREKVVNRVLVDEGSGLNIYPLSTFRQLRFDLGKWEKNHANVRAFDGVQRDTLGAVTLAIQMAPVEFSVQFQVLDIDTSYNLLLGRSFIHMDGAVPCTFHQMMKLGWRNEDLVFPGEGSYLGRQVSIIDEFWRGFCDLLEEIDAVVKEEVELAGIRDAERGESPKRTGKIRICVDYSDLHKASPKDNFPLPNILIWIENCVRHEMQSFVDCYEGYHQILVDEKDAEKRAFITPWGVYHYRVMLFRLKNAGATYM
ncbi:uncharacterized protein [Solanum lycopersicum]|uniref:uncharacterized protein n=1 Tax=Solanum lycopersicum TaxID=4081 RepID=UPI003748C669